MKLKTCGASISGEDPITGCDVPICVVGTNWPDRAEAAAMARRIVLACNAHEGLVTALEAMIAYSEETENCNLCAAYDGEHEPTCPVKAARAALALARGQ